VHQGKDLDRGVCFDRLKVPYKVPFYVIIKEGQFLNGLLDPIFSEMAAARDNGIPDFRDSPVSCNEHKFNLRGFPADLATGSLNPFPDLFQRVPDFRNTHEKPPRSAGIITSIG